MAQIQELSEWLSAKSMVACTFDQDGTVTGRQGPFVPDKLLLGSSVYDSCDFIFGVPETMSPGEQVPLNGIHFGREQTESIIDVLLVCDNAERFSMIIEDQTTHYTAVNQLGQERNEADILQHQLLRQNEQLHLLKQAAESASKTRTEFLAKVSHEIRTPLNALLGFADMLEKTALDDQQQRHLDHIQTAGDALSNLLTDLLDLSKMESGKYQIENAEFDFGRMIADSATLCRNKIDEKGLAFNVEVDPQIPASLSGDRLRLSQVVLNLLTNAVKFTDKGQIDLVARCKQVTPVSILAEIQVRDTGRGIPEEQQQQIFERFSQARLADSTELGGVGLGLAIVRQLVEAMGGAIEVESQPGQGATFSVTVPMKRIVEESGLLASDDGINPEAHAAVDGQAVSSTGVELAGMTILVAEDSALNQQYVKEILLPNGAELLVVESGAAALQALLTEPVDLVLMDIHMPEMNGDEAIRRIREDLLFPIKSVPVIAFSGKASDQEQLELLEIGADEALAKPYSPDSLLAAISRIRQPRIAGECSLDKMLSDDISQKMIDIFKTEVPVYLRDLLVSLFAQQERQFVFHAHKMQSAMWVMELMSLYEILARLENEPLDFETRLGLCTEFCQEIESMLAVSAG